VLNTSPITNVSPLALFVQSFIPRRIVLGIAFIVILDEFFFFGKLNTRFWPCLKLVWDLCYVFIIIIIIIVVVIILLFSSFCWVALIVIDLFVFIRWGDRCDVCLKLNHVRSPPSYILSGSFNPCFQLRLISAPSLRCVWNVWIARTPDIIKL
jgi:hypothetical protein